MDKEDSEMMADKIAFAVLVVTFCAILTFKEILSTVCEYHGECAQYNKMHLACNEVGEFGDWRYCGLYRRKAGVYQ